MNTGALRLFQSSGSPNSRRVRIYLAEKGICVALVPVDLGAKEQFSAAYATINPRVVVPTLVLGDGTVHTMRPRGRSSETQDAARSRWASGGMCS